MPPGLYHDEAYNGLDALSVLAGARPVFFEANNGREPLFIYLVTASVGLLGRSPVAVRLVSAILGTLTVLAAYAMAAEWFGRRVGLLTATVTAITVWPVNLSRIGFRAVAMPLLVALVLWGLGRARRTRRLRPAVVSGALYGLLFYSYLAARFTPIALVLCGVYWLAMRRWPPALQRSPGRAGWTRRQLLAFVVTAFVVLLPLLGYVSQNAEVFLARSYQVSVFNPAINGGDLPGALARHAGRTLLAFTTRGDFIPRHNVPLRPVFDPLLAVAFVAGLVIAGRRFREPACGLTLIWVAVMLLPTVLAEDAPHFLRGVGVLPVLFVLPAVGLEAGWRWMGGRASLPIAWASLILLLSASLGWTVRDYFLHHTRSEAAYYQFETGAVQLAAEANRFLGTGWDGSGFGARESQPAPGRQVYIAERLWRDWAAIRFLVPETPAVTVLGSQKPQATDAADVLLFVWPFEEYQEHLDLLPRESLINVREGAWEQGDLEPEARLLYVSYRATVGGTGPANADARFVPPESPIAAAPIALTGYAVDQPDGWQVRVRLYWQALAEVDADLSVAPVPPYATPVPGTGGDWRGTGGQTGYTVFVHVVGPEGLIAQDDARPARGYYPTNRWRPGDQVVDEHLLLLPWPVGPDDAHIVVGLYRLETGTRLAVVDRAGRVLGDSVALSWK